MCDSKVWAYGHVNAVEDNYNRSHAHNHNTIMSAESIARWNAIPMTRSEDVQFASTKVLLVLFLRC